MAPAFTLNRLSTYLTRFYKIADSLVRHIESELDKSDGPSRIDMHVIGNAYIIGWFKHTPFFSAVSYQLAKIIKISVISDL